jgi:hypothetical protein
MSVDINYATLIVAALSTMVVGFLWYSPVLFGTLWMELSGFNKKDMEAMKSDMLKGYLVGFLLSLVTAYVLFHFIQVLDAQSNGQAIELAFWLWLGFQFTVMLGSVVWEKKPLKLALINSGNQFVSLVVMALIMVNWV